MVKKKILYKYMMSNRDWFTDLFAHSPRASQLRLNNTGAHTFACNMLQLNRQLNRQLGSQYPQMLLNAPREVIQNQRQFQDITYQTSCNYSTPVRRLFGDRIFQELINYINIPLPEGWIRVLFETLSEQGNLTSGTGEVIDGLLKYIKYVDSAVSGDETEWKMNLSILIQSLINSSTTQSYTGGDGTDTADGNTGDYNTYNTGGDTGDYNTYNTGGDTGGDGTEAEA